MYTVEYYLALKKEEILPLPTAWMDLEGTVLSEVSQTVISAFWLTVSVILG